MRIRSFKNFNNELFLEKTFNFAHVTKLFRSTESVGSWWNDFLFFFYRSQKLEKLHKERRNDVKLVLRIHRHDVTREKKISISPIPLNPHFDLMSTTWKREYKYLSILSVFRSLGYCYFAEISCVGILETRI